MVATRRILVLLSVCILRNPSNGGSSRPAFASHEFINTVCGINGVTYCADVYASGMTCWMTRMGGPQSGRESATLHGDPRDLQDLASRAKTIDGDP